MAVMGFKATHWMIVLICILGLAFIAFPCGKTQGQIAREFYDGFHAALKYEPRSQDQSEHWRSGWDAGCSVRSEQP